jgi:hypothetical protein
MLMGKPYEEDALIAQIQAALSRSTAAAPELALE